MMNDPNKPALLIGLLTIFAAALLLAAWWPEPEPTYKIKDFCRDHPDVCQRGRLAVTGHYGTPTPSR